MSDDEWGDDDETHFAQDTSAFSHKKALVTPMPTFKSQRYFFLAAPDTLAFRYLAKRRVALLTEKRKSLSRNIIAIQVIGINGRLILMKLVSLQEQGNRLMDEMAEHSSTIVIDTWFHIRSINKLFGDSLASQRDM